MATHPPPPDIWSITRLIGGRRAGGTLPRPGFLLPFSPADVVIEEGPIQKGEREQKQHSKRAAQSKMDDANGRTDEQKSRMACKKAENRLRLVSLKSNRLQGTLCT